MAKYIYPAVFTKEVEGGYSVNFPDVPSCYTCGENLYDAIKMAKDVLALILYDLEQDRKEIPVASDIKDIITKKDEFVSSIAVVLAIRASQLAGYAYDILKRRGRKKD